MQPWSKTSEIAREQTSSSPVSTTEINSLIVRSEYSSSLNIFNQKYFRTNSYSSLSYYFEAIQLNVSMNGNYTIISISNIDTFGYIYKNAFNPTFPFLNLISSNDDTGGNRQFKLKLYLNIEIEYILIVTTYDVNITGSYSILTTGPASIRFSSINIKSKNSICFTNFLLLLFFQNEMIR